MGQLEVSVRIILVVVQISLFVSALGARPARAQDFSSTRDILFGRRVLLPVDDLALVWAKRPDEIETFTGFAQNNEIAVELTSNLGVLSGPIEVVVGRMFASPSDVAVVAANGRYFITDDEKLLGQGQISQFYTGPPLEPSAVVLAATMGDYTGDGLDDIALSFRNGAAQPALIVVGTPVDVNDISQGLKFGALNQDFGGPLFSSLTSGDFDGDGTMELAGSTTTVEGCSEGSNPGAAVVIYRAQLNPEEFYVPALVASVFVRSSACLGPDGTTGIVAGQYKPRATPTSPFTDQLALIFHGRLDNIGKAGPVNTVVASIDVDPINFAMTLKDRFTLLANRTSNTLFAGAASGRLVWNGPSEQLVTVSGVESSTNTLIKILGFDEQLAINQGASYEETIFPPEPGAASCAVLDIASQALGVALGNFAFDPGNEQQSAEDPTLQIAVLMNFICANDAGPAGIVLYPATVTNELGQPLCCAIPQNPIFGRTFVDNRMPNPPNYGIAAGSLQGRELRVGSPAHVRISHHQPLVSLAAPPAHVDYIVPPNEQTAAVVNMTAVQGTLEFANGYFSEYEFKDAISASNKNVSQTSFSFGFKESASGKISYGEPGDEVSESFKTSAKQTHDNQVRATVDYGSGQNVSIDQAAFFTDQVWYKSQTVNFWIYDVIGQKICPAGLTCPPDAEEPLQVLFSLPESPNVNQNIGNVTEFYQPAHEPLNILSYPPNPHQLNLARQRTNPAFDLNKGPLEGGTLSGGKNSTYSPGDAAGSKTESWTESEWNERTVESSRTFSFDESTSISAEGTVDGFGVEGTASFSANQAAAFKTVITSTQQMDESSGFTVSLPNDFEQSNAYNYGIRSFVVGQPFPEGTLQEGTARQCTSASAQSSCATKGPFDLTFVANPLTSEIAPGTYWGRNSYSAAPDVALNHPNRWSVQPSNESTPNCFRFVADGQVSYDCATFRGPGSDPWSSEFYWLRGLLITNPPDAKNPQGGPQAITAVAGDTLHMQVRVYNYSFVDIPDGTDVHVRFYGQEWLANSNTPAGDSFLIDEVVLSAAAAKPPVYDGDNLNWVFVPTTFDTTSHGGQYLVFWVLVWLQDESGLVSEVVEHGLTELPGTIAQITDVPVESFSNNAGLLKQAFYVCRDEAACASQTSGEVLALENASDSGLKLESVAVSRGQALLNQKLEARAVLRAGDAGATGVLVTFYDGDPNAGGQSFDVELISRIRAGEDHGVRVPYRPRTCGVHTIFAEARKGSAVVSDSAEVDVNCLSETAILATKRISLGKGSRVASGNVVDNAAGGKIVIGKGSNTAGGFSVIADKVEVKKDARVASNVAFNELENRGILTGKQADSAELPVFPGVPDFRTAVPGTEKILVQKNETRVLPPGDYGKIVVRKGAKLVFSGGVYNVKSIKVKKRSSLIFEAAAEVRVARNFSAGSNTFVGPSDDSAITASDIVFYVAGKKASLARKSVAKANFYARDGKVNFKGSEATGTLIGEKVKTGDGSTVHLDSFVRD